MPYQVVKMPCFNSNSLFDLHIRSISTHKDITAVSLADQV